jgi:hypothetical protein
MFECVLNESISKEGHVLLGGYLREIQAEKPYIGARGGFSDWLAIARLSI